MRWLIYGPRGSWLVLGLALGGCAPPAPVIVLRSGAIHTMDASGTIAEAMVVRDGEIVYVGRNEGTARYEGPQATILDLAGKVVLPGFHDAHTHLLLSGAELLSVDVSSATTVDELVEAVATWAAANPESEWVRGGGWSMSAFQGLLHKSQLDAVVPARPVFLWSIDGHTGFANSRALELAGIGAGTPDPEDGIIERDERGEPTGVLQEAAAYLVAELVPAYSDAQVDEGLARAQREASMLGITTIVEAQVDEPWLLEGYARAEADGRLLLRVHAALVVEPTDEGFVERLEAWRDEYESERVAIDTAKLFLDGIIESQTAYLLEPYVDGTDAAPIFTDAQLEAAALALDAAGFQLHAHAIGDGATRQFLDVIEAVRLAHGARDRRPILAHLELVDPSDFPRFAALGVYACFQPLWAYPDSYIQELTWPVIGPARSEHLYPLGGLHRAGASLVAGSDWSVSSMNPFEAIEVAITRQDPWTDDGLVLTPAHRIDLVTALRAYTSTAAETTFSEDRSGTLEEGKHADFIVVDRDPFEVPAYELSDVVVEQTWLGGALVFERDGG